MDISTATWDPVEQVRAFVDWVGTGCKLTQTGRITMTDARILVEALGTDDVIDPTIGDRVFRTKSSQELPHLRLIVEWAKTARLVRKTGNRLVPVKKNAAVLADASTLRLTLFTVFDQLGEAYLPAGFSESMLRLEFTVGIRTVLTSLHGAGNPVAMASLRAATWDVVTARYILDDATETQLSHWRAFNDRDTERALGILARLGAVTIQNGAVELTDFGHAGMRRLLGEPAPGYPVYQLKITLVDTEKPPVWRRVLVPADVPLDRLHQVIQAAMGWQDAHLHAFVDGQTYYGRPDPDLPYRDERATRLAELVKPGDHLAYMYDFGDGWEHDIAVEDATTAKSGVNYPMCVAGQGACPPEDSGGAPGYTRLIEVLADPRHQEHRDMLDWLGLDSRDQFDPTNFTTEEANRRLIVSARADFVIGQR